MKKMYREQGIPMESEYPKEPYTVQGLLDFLGNKKFGYEYRYDAMQLAGQLPRDEYLRFLKSAIEVNNGEFAVDAILRLFELDEQSMPSSINKLVLSLPEYGQRRVIFQFIKDQPVDPKYQFGSLSRQVLQQLLTPTPGSTKEQSESKSGTKLFFEMTEEARGKAREAGYSCLLLVTSTPVLTEDDQVLLRAARKQFSKDRRVWLAGSLAKDITENDLEIGQPIYTNTREYTPLRVAVALALAPKDAKAEQFFNASIEHLLSTAVEREDAIKKRFASIKSLDSDIDLLPSIKFHVELQYIGWLRFYNGANARTLILKCLNSKSHSVRDSIWIVAAKRFPVELITFLKKNSGGVNSPDRKKVEKYLALLVIFNPNYRKSVQEMIPQKTLDALMRSIEKKGIGASFEGASPYLGL